MDDCVFCRIVSGEAPAHMVFEDDFAVAFLDVRPLFAGHTLVVPREHFTTLAHLPTDQIHPLFTRAQTLSAIMRDPFGAQGSFVAMNNIVSQSVPHLHVHVVPRTRGDGLRGFFWPRTSYNSEQEMKSTAETLSNAFLAAWDGQA